MEKSKIHIIKDYLQALKQAAINAEYSDNLAERIVASTDNSIYQKMPKAIIYPKDKAAIQTCLKIAQELKYQHLTFTAKGGATGCNGQSLNQGIIIDCSRFMHKIIEMNLADEWVDVQPGVTLDELNQALKPYGYCFGPHVSPADRATIGGMMATDACGKGSMKYGRTSQHILSCEVVLANADLMQLNAFNKTALKQQQSKTQEVLNLCIANQDKISKTFKPCTRFLTGYNLAHVLNPKTSQYSLIPLFSGAEGTLGIITQLRCKLSKLSNRQDLIICYHNSFEDALYCVNYLKNTKPIAIEVLDETCLLNLKNSKINQNLRDKHLEKSQALSYILLDENSDLKQFKTILEKINNHHIHHLVVSNTIRQKLYWQVRSECVGLAAKSISKRKAIAFMEDHAVDPSRLVAYIKDIKSMLKKYKIEAPMYGHADVGCIHMRPKLDINCAKDREILNHLQKESIDIVKKHQGIIWAEHGKGFRNEALQDMFGDCYPLLAQVKAIFDPTNRLNPGKITHPAQDKSPYSTLGPLKNQEQSKLSQQEQDHYKHIFSCNGNGLCHSSQINQNMCPSYKYSRHKLHSPKGRAMLIKYWLQNKKQDPELEEQLFNSLENCLSCKACSHHCPVNIDIPSYKSNFLATYYQKHARPFSHHFLLNFEKTVPLQSKWANTIALLLKSKSLQTLIKNTLKLSQLPIPASPSLSHYFPKKSSQSKINQADICIIQDPFTTLYAPDLYQKAISIFNKLNKRAILLPYQEIGKTHELLGKIDQFKHIATRFKHWLKEKAGNKEIICIEPSMHYCLLEEYRKRAIIIEQNIKSLQACLKQYLPSYKAKKTKPYTQENHTFLPHCMEQNHPEAIQDWRDVFDQLNLTIEIKSLGCCGEAGLYSYKTNTEKASKEIFEKGWGNHISKTTHCITSAHSCNKRLTTNQKTSMHILDIINKIPSLIS
eukprot:COSAG01_NODE_1461_length_10242_cov_4.896283_6_plen_943_part_00